MIANTFIIIIMTVGVSRANPVIFSPQFEDDWNYLVTPHNDPIIKEQKIHTISLDSKERNNQDGTNNYDLLYTVPNGRESKTASGSGDVVNEIIPCSVCKLGVRFLQGNARKKRPFNEIKNKFVSLCVAFQIQTPEVCSGMFEVYGSNVLLTFNYTKLNPDEICYMILGESCEENPNASFSWNVDFPDFLKPPIETSPELKMNSPYIKVLQISDTHLDPEYVEGTPVNCKEPLCCRLNSTLKINEEIIKSGKWGSYGKCDTPHVLIENMFENIASTHSDLDYIIWTGDLPPHDIWNQTRAPILNNIREHIELMKKYFPNTPVFPVLGNHESVPSGSFSTNWVLNENYSTNWLYEEAEKQWTRWLPNETNITIHQGGFYSVLLMPGFRLISLNTNFCFTLNWWMLLNNTDPGKQLKWLVHELQQAENKKEKVHIIGHIPPGDVDCLKEWSKNYYKIVNRYESTIMAQFFGHSHGDEFEIFYDLEQLSIPINIAYIAPSVTTFGNYNPAYRIYYVNGGQNIDATWEVIDHETWTTDLEEANKEVNVPKWFKLYSAKMAYQMKSLKPEEWNNLFLKMIKEPKTFEMYYRYFFRNTNTIPICDTSCKIKLLCNIKSGRSHDRQKLCKNIIDELN